jgi:peroxiredoxin
MLTLSMCLGGLRCLAAEASEAATEMKALTAKMQAKMKEGKKTEADFADEFKEFDALLAKHKGEKTEEVASILYAKGMYLQRFGNSEKSIALLEQLKRDFPETKSGKNADKVIEMIKDGEKAKEVQSGLTQGTKFPEFNEKDVAGKPVSIAKYKGKVVLIDFWATWCGPCVHELPNVQKTYEKHHKDGFEIIGISLDKEEGKLTKFIEEKNMPWQQFFDGEGWKNKLAVQYGVRSIPATYLLDGEGKIIGQNLRGEALEAAVTKALAKN